MAGSMRPRGKDTWQLRVHAGRDPRTGRKRYVERTYRGPKKEAQRALAALVLEVERLSPRSAGDGTLEALCNEWLAHAAASFSPRTVTTTRGYLDQPIIPAIGAIQVARLTPADLDRFYRYLLEVGGPKGPYAPATIRRIHGIVRRALTQGVRWGWLSHNPAVDASPPRVPHRGITPPSPEELVRLVRSAQESDPDLAAFVMLAASTGARRGELIALRRTDVELTNGIVSIERGIVIAGDRLVEQGTKTHQSRRITIDPVTVEVLRAHLERQDRRAGEFGASMSRSAFVFTDAIDGSAPWRPDSATRAFRNLCARAEISGIRLHDLRHYVATRLLSSGIDVRTVAGRLGHRNPSTTLNVYAHFVPASDRQAADALAALFEAATQPQGGDASSDSDGA